MTTGHETVKSEINSNEWFVIGSWTQNLENAHFFKTFEEALQFQSKSNLELIKENRTKDNSMYEIFKTKSL